MHPTTTGRFRVHTRRSRPTDVADPTPVFVVVELPDSPVDLAGADPAAEDAYDPLYVLATGYDGALADQVASLEPGAVVDATLAWNDGTARFTALSVVRETRFRFTDDIEGMFEAAVETWQQIRAAGESVGSLTTRSTDGEPNGALYLFADGPGADTFEEVRTGRLPIEPLIARVNDTLDDGEPREVFVLRPEAYAFVAVYVVFERDGVLARTMRETYGFDEGLAAGLQAAAGDGGGDMEGDADTDTDAETDTETQTDTDTEFDLTDRL